MNIKGQFDRAMAVILSENDLNPDKESRDAVRNVVLSELNDLRRWTAEVIEDAKDNGPTLCLSQDLSR